LRWFFLFIINQFNGRYHGLFDSTDEFEEGQQKKSATIEESFASNWGWIYNAKQVSEFEAIGLDAVYDLPVVQFLNDLSYLKSKRQLDEHQYKQSASGFS
jgi:hypothetical protein